MPIRYVRAPHVNVRRANAHRHGRPCRHARIGVAGKATDGVEYMALGQAVGRLC